MSQQRSLEGRIALVAGATRGAGRGIATMLGERGATVYCTGRGSRDAPSSAGYHAGRPETIEETAERVDRVGGVGIPVRVDHADPAQVTALVERVVADHGRLDLLVNVLGGAQAEDWSPLWQQSMREGRALAEGWIWPHITTAHTVLPRMVSQGGGLLVELVEGETIGYRPPFFFDLALVTLKRLAFALAEEGAPHGVCALAVAPGFMRTEQILDHFGATEQNWREVARTSAEARGFGFAGSETPCFVGRAVAALASDPGVTELSGGVFSSWELAERYGFNDLNGERLHWGRYLAEHFPRLADSKTATGRRWEITGGSAGLPAAAAGPTMGEAPAH